jgi:selenophosphate synthetase-related protein
MKSKKLRDLTLIDLGDKWLVIAVDSCGGIGVKKEDILNVDPVLVGGLTLRVTLMEVLSTGAEIISVTNGVMNEFHPTGEKLLEGINNELKAAKIEDVIINGSSEENFSPVSTGLAITVIGIVNKEDLKVGNDLKGLKIGLAGKPKVGNEIKLPVDDELVTYDEIYKLLKNENIVEIIPVGSKGITGELKQIKSEIKLSTDIDVGKSAGPATCALVFYKGDDIKDVKQIGDVL